MIQPRGSPPVRYRVWLVVQAQGQQADPIEQPLIATEPAEEGTLSARHAARYVTAFNRTAARLRRAVRAVALPVTIRYEGDPRPGQRLVVGESPPVFPDHFD